MKFYVLVSYHLDSFKKCIHYIPKDQLIVVINTKFTEYLVSLENYCIDNNIEYYITESDGTPATGKNSVIELFLERDDEYMMMIDGDDFITPYGVQYYNTLSRSESSPDLVVLYKQTSVSHIDVDLFDENTTAQDLKKYSLEYPLDKSDPALHDMPYDELVKYFYHAYGMDMRTSERWAVARRKFNDIMNLYSEEYEYMTRMVFVSKRAAQKMHFDNSIIIGEDTIQCLKLKRMALNNELVMVRKNDGVKPTYVINREQPGICMAVQKQIHWEWLFPFLDKISQIELPPPNIKLPEISG